MRIALPLAGGRLSPHFGHCEEFSLIDVDRETGDVVATNRVAAPPHVPGMLPGWLREQGVHAVIAGGMGPRAVELFAAASIQVSSGAPMDEPEKLVRDYLAGRLETGANSCDHSSGQPHEHHCESDG